MPFFKVGKFPKTTHFMVGKFLIVSLVIKIWLKIPPETTGKW